MFGNNGSPATAGAGSPLKTKVFGNPDKQYAGSGPFNNVQTNQTASHSNSPANQPNSQPAPVAAVPFSFGQRPRNSHASVSTPLPGTKEQHQDGSTSSQQSQQSQQPPYQDNSHHKTQHQPTQSQAQSQAQAQAQAQAQTHNRTHTYTPAAIPGQTSTVSQQIPVANPKQVNTEPVKPTSQSSTGSVSGFSLPSKIDELEKKAQGISLGGTPDPSSQGSSVKEQVRPEPFARAPQSPAVKPTAAPNTDVKPSAYVEKVSSAEPKKPAKTGFGLPSVTSPVFSSGSVPKRPSQEEANLVSQTKSPNSKNAQTKDLVKHDSSVGSISSKPVKLHELSTVLSFPQSGEYFPWIGRFHPEGTVFHPSLPYMAVVYNEVGFWNKEQVLLLASSETLCDQMDWEIRVALFFRKYSKKSRSEILNCLGSVPKDEALMFIAFQTAREAHEVILAPTVGSALTDLNAAATVDTVKEWATSASENIKEKVQEADVRCTETQKRLQASGVPEKDFWNNMTSDERWLLADLAKARILIWQLDALLPYFSPYTGLVHVSTTRWDPYLTESVPFHALVEFAPILSEFQTKGIDPTPSLARQYEVLQKFLVHVDLAVDVKGEPRSLVLNAVSRPEGFVPFELFFSKDQESQVENFMRTITGTFSDFFFIAPPAPVNKQNTFYSIEGIIEPTRLLHSYGVFKAKPLTLSLSKITELWSLDQSVPTLNVQYSLTGGSKGTGFFGNFN